MTTVRRRTAARLLVATVLLLVGVAAWIVVDEDGDGGGPPAATADPEAVAPRATTTAPPAAPRRSRAKAAEAAREMSEKKAVEAANAPPVQSLETIPLRIRVLADEDDAPIAGAVVRGAERNTAVRRMPEPDVSEWRVWAAEREALGQKTDPERLATTDGEGRCSLTAPDGWPVEIRADGRWPEKVQASSAVRGEVLVWLRRAGRIRARVAEPDGTPVPNAKVVLLAAFGPRGWFSSPGGATMEATADVEGRVAFEVPCGTAIDVVVFRPGTESPACRSFVRVTPRRPEVELPLLVRGRARLRIDVVRPDGTAARGAVVEVFDSGRLRRLAQGRAEDGRVEQDVEGGMWTLNAVFEASPLEFTKDVLVGVVDGETVERTLHLLPTVAISGQVVDGEGRGIGGARIEWRESPGTLRTTSRRTGMGSDAMLAPVPPTVVTDAGGRFSLGGLRPGRHVGRLIAPGALPRRVEVTAPADDVQLVVAASARVRWTFVVDGGAVVPGEVTFWWVPGGDERFALGSRLVGAGGAFSTSMPPGPGRLGVHDLDGGQLVERELDLAPGATADLGALPVPRWRKVRGRIAAEGELRSFVHFATVRSDGTRGSGRRTEVQPDGAFVMEAREAENERIVVLTWSGAGAASDVLPVRGDVDVGTLTPQPLGRLRGAFLRQTGSMPGAPATWRAVPGFATEALPVAVDGGFDGMLLAGRIRIVIRSEGFGSCEQDIEILPGRTTEATFRLKQ